MSVDVGKVRKNYKECPSCGSVYCVFDLPINISQCCYGYFRADKIVAEFAREEKSKKPPLGLVPAKTFYRLRLKDINEAIERYVEFGKDIPFEWIKEKNSLEEYLNK